MADNSFPHEAFDDLLAANAEYQKTFKYSNLTGEALKGLAIVTCMDSRINPLSVVGMKSGDVKILRNAGARVTEDVLRTLVLATYLLNVNRILVLPIPIAKWQRMMKQIFTELSMKNMESILQALNFARQRIREQHLLVTSTEFVHTRCCAKESLLQAESMM